MKKLTLKKLLIFGSGKAVLGETFTPHSAKSS